MIVRIWHGRTKASEADRYLEFLQRSGVQEYMDTPGNREVNIWRSIEGEVAHFWTVSTWDTMESIKAFSGADVEKAKYYPEDQDFLLEFESKVMHYESFKIK